jgi:glycosyltransferase involved in cell wall biosynthesis
LSILFLTQVLPFPLDAGPKVRAYYTLRRLAERYPITLATFVRATDTPEAQSEVARYCERVLTLPMPRSRGRDVAALVRSWVTGRPFLIERDQAPAMHRALAGLAAQTRFDYVHADQLWMAPYALRAQTAAAAIGRRPITILDQHNAVHLIPQRLAEATTNPLARAVLQRETRLMARYEAAMCRAIDRVVTVTEADQAALRALNPDAAPKFAGVIPICVAPNGQLPGPGPARGARVLFLGGMHWPPNADGVRWFVRDIWPRIRAQAPQAEFWAVGKQPPSELRPARAGQGVHAPGYAAGLDEHWQQAAIFVVPLRAGGGMRVKILDAWQHGLPVVSTTVGAEGLTIEDGHNLLLADTPAAFADAVVQVLTDGGLARRLAEAGHATLRRHYDWRTVYAAWEAVYAAP